MYLNKKCLTYSSLRKWNPIRDKTRPNLENDKTRPNLENEIQYVTKHV